MPEAGMLSAMPERVACPRCGQDWLVRVELVALSRRAAFCPECEALWLDDGAIGPSSFVDAGTYLRQAGRDPDRAGEIRILFPLERDAQ